MCAHLQRKWNEPSRSDHYVMQLSALVANILRRRGTQPVKVGQMKLSWRFGDRASGDKLDAMGKGRWLGALAAVGPGLVDEHGNRMGAAEIREHVGLKLYDAPEEPTMHDVEKKEAAA